MAMTKQKEYWKKPRHTMYINILDLMVRMCLCVLHSLSDKYIVLHSLSILVLQVKSSKCWKCLANILALFFIQEFASVRTVLP